MVNTLFLIAQVVNFLFLGLLTALLVLAVIYLAKEVRSE